MNVQIGMRLFLFLGLLLFVPIVAHSQNEKISPPQPRFDLTVERVSILPKDEIPLSLWIANSTDQILEDVELHLDAPSFLHLDPGDCKGVTVNNVGTAALIGSLAPGSIFTCRPMLRTDYAVEQGEFAIVFGLQYRWPGSGKTYLIREQKVEASLFGTGTVAGIDISLLTYLAPGLIVFALLRFLRLPNLEKLNTLESSGGAVTFSILMLLGFSIFGRTVSPLRFLLLCLFSVFLGIVLAAPMLWRRTQKRRRKQLLIGETEATAPALKKAFRQMSEPCTFTGWLKSKGLWLALNKKSASNLSTFSRGKFWRFLQRAFPLCHEKNPNPILPIRVQVKENEETYWGSMSGATAKGIKLFGWYVIDPREDENLRNKLQGLIEKKDLKAVLELVEDKNLKLDPMKLISDSDDGREPNEIVLTQSDWMSDPQPAPSPKKGYDWFPIRLLVPDSSLGSPSVSEKSRVL